MIQRHLCDLAWCELVRPRGEPAPGRSWRSSGSGPTSCERARSTTSSSSAWPSAPSPLRSSAAEPPPAGYDARTEQWFRALLPVALERGTWILSNLGAANLLGAGRLAIDIARKMDLACEVAVVTGDDVVLTGRVADPSLFLAPLANRLGWDLSNPAAAAHGTLVGHLLECGTKLTGGFFADPGRKDVPALGYLGYPWADVSANGEAVLGKLQGTGGLLDRRTVREQLLYEISDPGAYLTPDVVLDLYGVTLTEQHPTACGSPEPPDAPDPTSSR